MSSKSEQAINLDRSAKFDVLRIVFLSVFAAAVASFGPFSVFTPVPLTIGLLFLGPLLGLTPIILGALFLALLANYTGNLRVSLSLFAMASVFSLLLFGLFKKQLSPALIVFRASTIVILFISIAVLILELGSDFSVYEYTVAALEAQVVAFRELKASEIDSSELGKVGGEGLRQLEDFLAKPMPLISDFVSKLPSYLVGTTLFTFWISVGMVLRLDLVWKRKTRYPFKLKDLLSFRIPDFIIYFLILGLGLYLAGEQLDHRLEIFGINILFCLLPLFFFQGIGVFVASLSHFKMGPPFRSLLSILVLFFAWQMIAVIGLSDIWFNFRRFFEEKE